MLLAVINNTKIRVYLCNIRTKLSLEIALKTKFRLLCFEYLLGFDFSFSRKYSNLIAFNQKSRNAAWYLSSVRHLLLCKSFLRCSLQNLYDFLFSNFLGTSVLSSVKRVQSLLERRPYLPRDIWKRTSWLAFRTSHRNAAHPKVAATGQSRQHLRCGLSTSIYCVCALSFGSAEVCLPGEGMSKVSPIPWSRNHLQRSQIVTHLPSPQSIPT